MASLRDRLTFLLNGSQVEVGGDEAFLTLSDFLRKRRRLVGTKIVCAEGDCGACSVLVGRPAEGGIRYEPVDACILFLHQLDGTHVVTVEGLRPDRRTLSPVQEAMVRHFGSQCGFCTPGIVVALTALLEEEGELDERRVRQGLTGNLCRCTGYLQILEAAAAVDAGSAPRLSDLYPDAEILAALGGVDGDSIHVEAGERTLFVPHDLTAALEYLAERPEATITSGATDVGVQVNKGTASPSEILSLGRRIAELQGLELGDDTLSVGAATPLSRLERAAGEKLPELQAILRLFGAPQIRNQATLGGNIVNASPIADTLPFLFVTEAELDLRSVTGSRSLSITDLYRGYKDLRLEPSEMVVAVRCTPPSNGQLLKLYKMSKRRDLDISTLTAAILLQLDGETVSEARVAFGGVAPVVLRLPRTESVLQGGRFGEDLFRDAGRTVRTEISPITDVRGSASFRSQLAENLMLKCFYDLRGELAA